LLDTTIESQHTEITQLFFGQTLRLVPTVVMTTTAATAISAAISPYSIAVTPRLSVIRQYRAVRFRIIGSPH
jgi:hypothetical protein